MSEGNEYVDCEDINGGKYPAGECAEYENQQEYRQRKEKEYLREESIRFPEDWWRFNK